MPDTISPSAFAELFISDTPLLDLRAPIEFKRGAFPAATNLPLLDDEQRRAVGTRFKQAGRDGAIALGHELISGEIRRQRLEVWGSYLTANPGALLYCFRGGLRSSVVQQWLREAGFEVPRIEGGYKALRRFLIDTLDRVALKCRFIVIGGKTGSGKTQVVNALPFSVDLEGLARHRGSAFGKRMQPQPNQIDFENLLAVAFLKLPYRNARRVFLEDESRAVGSLSLPPELFNAMRSSPLAIIEESPASRVDTILNDYIDSNHRDFKARHPDSCEQRFAGYLLGALDRIRRRLGEENHAAIRQLMQRALDVGDRDESLALHRQWIHKLLADYYDPMYDYQLSKKSQAIVFRGTRQELLAWAAGIRQLGPQSCP